MDVAAILLALVALALVVWWVSAPLRGGAATAEERDASRIADLEAAKEAKYREIREAELDFRTGKLDEGDWKALDRELRAEAVELLRALDEYHR
ncbi:hypothetical protein [Conexibacter sp. SYSU D00693]|uniref:hypothetical protein n=1 Tax=Conexibacter sp. SYSU D00693 TaxID=2812560 RepID=UPI00196AF119|nr:hypothetical protein [Conexibacter sp. SYSU D00693]